MNSPLTVEDFSALMGQLGMPADAGKFVVACSGGSDSMALVILAAEWGSVTALTFDHGLRAESGCEAEQVAHWMAARKIEHHILRADDLKPGSGLPARAREARYLALETWCCDHDVDYLLLGHHRDDQAETFLMRLARGSGVDGLSAMAKISPPVACEKRPLLIRPLIDVPKARLQATLEARGQDWIEDPSNTDLRFLRTRVRNFLERGEIEGLDNQRLATTAKHMARSRYALEYYANAHLQKCFTFGMAGEMAGFGILDHQLFLDAPEEIQLRDLSRLVRVLGGAKYPPRLVSIENLLNQIVNGNLKGLTLGGVLFEPVDMPEKNKILVCREAAAIADERALEPGGTVLWDGRYHIHASKTAPAVMLGVLGEKGWLMLAKQYPDVTKTGCPYAARLALPALRNQGKFVAVPNLGYPELENTHWRFESALPSGLYFGDETGGAENSKQH